MGRKKRANPKLEHKYEDGVGLERWSTGVDGENCGGLVSQGTDYHHDWEVGLSPFVFLEAALVASRKSYRMPNDNGGCSYR